MLRECLVKHVSSDCANEPRNSHRQNSEMRVISASLNITNVYLYSTTSLTEIYDVTEPKPVRSTPSTIYNNVHCVCEVALWIWSEYELLNPPKCSVYHNSVQPSAEPYGCANNLIQASGRSYFLFKSLVTVSVCYSDPACLRRGGRAQSVIFSMSPNYYCSMNCLLFCWEVAWSFMLSHIGDVFEIKAVSRS